MTDLDRNQYIHNMEIVSHLPGATIEGGEPLMTMWARGKQRMLPGSGGLVDISDAKKPEVAVKGIRGFAMTAVVFHAKTKKWMAMCTAAAPLTSATPQYPHGQYDKSLRDISVNYKGLRGIRTFDLSDPLKPTVMQEFSTGTTGNGTHHNFYDGGQYAPSPADYRGWDDQAYAWKITSAPSAQRHHDLVGYVRSFERQASHPSGGFPATAPRRGSRIQEVHFHAAYQAYWTGNHGSISVPKRVEDGGTVGYGGFGAFGMYCMVISDIKNRKPYGHMQYEFNPIGDIPFHTCFPVIADAAHPQLANKVVATHEILEADCRSPYHTPYVVDVKDPRNPKIIGFFPRPAAPPDAPYSDFCFARGRFGSHNTQCWLAPGAAKANIMVIAWFNAGVRVFDIANPTAPKEIAWFVPPRDGDIAKYETWWRGTTENVFVEWDRNLIWIGTHEGSYCLSCPALGKPITEPTKVTRWTVPPCNNGWDAQTPTAFYFGRGQSQMG